MDPLSQTLLLCTATLMVSASAVSAFDLTQRTYPGFQWWSVALWLNAAAVALLAMVDFGYARLPLGQLLLVPWPMLCLAGLRRFHARMRLPGSTRGDLRVLAAVLLVSVPLVLWPVDGLKAATVPMLAGAAMLLYAAAVAWLATGQRDAIGVRTLGTLWPLTALLPLPAVLSAQGQQSTVPLQTTVVALGSLVTAFVLLALCSHRTEHELRESRRRLRVLANIDMLTQVPNRRRFEELARRALQADAPGSAALLLVDIDHFKQINDKLGHAAGDRALRLVSRCTLDLLRSHDVAGRHGGDEFVLLLRQSSTQTAMLVAERLVARLQTQAHAYALPRLSLSFGIVQMRDGESIDETLQRADEALYEAKRLGRSRAVASDVDESSLRPVFRSSQRLGLTAS
jgi:diguanylate cyclase (GGDEF)-like protein